MQGIRHRALPRLATTAGAPLRRRAFWEVRPVDPGRLSCVFRRRPQTAPAEPESDQEAEASGQARREDPGGRPPGPAPQAGKGRPTPKRSEAERRRRQPYTAPPANRRAATAQDREHRRTEQRRRMDAMRRGEEWALPPRDRGPVRALARDYVDSRRLLVSEYILFGVFALILAVFLLGASKNGSVVLYIELAIVGVITLEALYHGSVVRRMARRRFPDLPANGLLWYVAKRSIRLRSTRIPPARVTRGQATF